MPTTIEQLELEVQSSSTSAVAGIDALSASLSKLKNAVRGGVGLTSVANQVRNLDTALKSMDSSGADKIDKLASSLEKLKGLGSLKISSSIGNQLQNIGSAAASLTGVDFSAMEKLGTALQPLNNLNASGLKSTINALNKLPKLADTLDNMDMTKFTSQIQQLSTALAPLTNQLNAVTSAFNRLPTNIQRAITVTNRISQENNKAANSYMNLYAKIKMAMGAVRTGARVIASWITQSNQYIEDLNLFTASMGEYAGEAQKYAEAVSEALGIDPGEFMRNQGVFNTIITGFGVVSDKAYLMSKNLTQLGYDISSFFNISFEDAMQKLQSGIAGELEPLRRLGYDLSVARLQEEALALGIEKKVSAMTQAEKSQLRYYAIMTQVTTAQGDMARTLNAPANQLRVLQAQVTQCARALGNIFIPALNAVLPYAIALAKIVRMLTNSIASLFGFKLPEVDYSGISAGVSAVGDLADNAGDASDGLGKAGKAAKKLKNALLGIDELNVLSKDDSSSGSGSGSGAGIGGGDLGIDLPTYDFLGDAITSKVDEIVQMIKDAMWEITAVISGFLLAIGTILVVTGANIPLGLGLMAVGAVGLAATVMANWNGMSERLAKVLTLVTGVLGGFLLAIGAFLVFSGVNVPLGAGLMVAGAAALGTAAVINWKFLNGDLSNALSILTAIVSGALLAMGALFAFTGVDVPLGIALMAAGAVGMVTAIGLNWDSMSDPLRRTIGMLETIVGGALLTFGAILALTGVNVPLGVAMIAAGAVSVASAVSLNWNSLTGDVQESVLSIVAIVSGALIGVGAILALTGVATGLGIAMIAAGAVGLAATVGLNWNSMPDNIRKVTTKILLIAGAASIAIGMILAFTGVATPLGVGLILAGAAALGTAVALNWDTLTSVVGKGIAFTRKRLLTHLRKYYAQHGSNEGCILLIDFSKYYDNIRHDVLLKLFEQYVDDEHALWLLRKTVERSRIDVSYMSDEEYEHCLDRLFDSLLYQYMNPKLFTGEKFMGKHLNIGDQVAQTAGISYRIRIDNYVKIVRGVKFYAGYMDDSYAIHESKEFLQELLEDIIEIANELGITVNTRKTRICKLSEHWRFLQVQYSLTDTGRVIQKINPKRLTAMRRKMKKLAPKLTEKEFTDFYKSWFKNHYKIMSKKQRSNMDTLFNQLKEVTKCTLSPLPMAKS